VAFSKPVRLTMFRMNEESGLHGKEQLMDMELQVRRLQEKRDDALRQREQLEKDGKEKL